MSTKNTIPCCPTRNYMALFQLLKCCSRLLEPFRQIAMYYEHNNNLSSVLGLELKIDNAWVPSIIVGIKKLSTFVSITVTHQGANLPAVNVPLVMNIFSLKDALKGLYLILQNNLGIMLAIMINNYGTHGVLQTN